MNFKKKPRHLSQPQFLLEFAESFLSFNASDGGSRITDCFQSQPVLDVGRKIIHSIFLVKLFQCLHEGEIR
jgi:hypothetical protein